MIGISLLPYNPLSPLNWARAINDWDEFNPYPLSPLKWARAINDWDEFTPL